MGTTSKTVTMKTAVLFAAAAMMVASISAEELIEEITIKVNSLSYLPFTADIIIEVCGTGRGRDQCCETDELREETGELFTYGEKVKVDGRDLGDCRDFDLGDDIDEDEIEINIEFTGLGIAAIDDVTVETSGRREFTCEYDFDLFETGSNFDGEDCEED